MAQRSNERSDQSSVQLHNISLQLSPQRTDPLGQKPVVIQIPNGVEVKIRDVSIVVTAPAPVSGEKQVVHLSIKF